MLRGGPPVSAQDKLQEKQKQKKRLSFKDPEVEGPQRTYFFGGCRSKTTLTGSTKLPYSLRKNSSSVEDLSLEDQALQIAQSVGNAFSDLSVDDTSKSNFLETDSSNGGTKSAQVEEKYNDCSPSDFVSYQRSCQLRSFRISNQDQEYLDDLKSPLLDLTMRCPSIEANRDLDQHKNCIPTNETMEERYPSSAQHQIQLLKYQLDQQSQQTQMALHQVQLLTDQMEAESTARHKAQEQNNQLMLQNKELLNHMEKLFQQIEDLEKQVHTLEQEKKSRIPQLPEPQATQLKPAASYSGIRRPSNDQLMHEKPVQNRNINTPIRRSSLSSSKPFSPQNKPATSSVQQNTGTTTKKSSVISQRPYLAQSKTTDSSNKTKELLRIGDTSPPVQSTTISPFNSGWKPKPPETNNFATQDKTVPSIRNRTGSFSSYSKIKPVESGGNAKSTLFSSNSNLPNATGITSKKYSSSTSDLYNSTSALQINKPLLIEEPSVTTKNSISSLSVNAPSKLPRYQPYAWRRNSVSNESAQSTRETLRNTTETSLFSR